MSVAQSATEGLSVLAAAGGIVDWGNTKVAEVGTFFRGFSVVAAIGFVIFQALASRGAFARIIIAGLAAGVFVWIVWHVTDLRDRVDKEMQPAAVGQLQEGPGAGPPPTALPGVDADVGAAVRAAAAGGGGNRP